MTSTAATGRVVADDCVAHHICDPGDRITFVSAGGGGYGNPFERDPKAVERDVEYGYVSIERAEKDYGVIIEPDSLKLDLAATQKLRETNRS